MPVTTSIEEDPMPYDSISDLPEAQVDQYTQHQKKAFLEAFNSAYEQYDRDESRAFAVAHTAAKQAKQSDDD
jgi:cation transport regulator